TLVGEQKVALIHAHFLLDGVRIARFARHHRLPLIITAHGYDVTTWPSEQMKNKDGRFLRLMRGPLIDAVSKIVCVSDFIRGELEARGYPAQKLVTLPLGVDLERLGQGRPAAERSGVLFAGRLVEKKGLRYLLDAWSRLSPELRNEPLTIIGDGHLRGELQVHADSLGVNATFLGAQPRDSVLHHMAKSRVFVFPSVRAASGDAEGMGVVAMEAQALGTPVVAFDNGPAPEAIADGESGLLAKDRDCDSLAASLTRILQEPGLAARLGANGPRIADQRFSLVTNTARLEALYDEVRSGLRKST
ncbi:MAG: glycosyltransferase, partial [Caulobacteraceae bacterium]